MTSKVFTIPKFKSLEVLEKVIFVIMLLYINPNTNHQQIVTLTVKKKLRKRNCDLFFKSYKVDVTLLGFVLQATAWKT